MSTEHNPDDVRRRREEIDRLDAELVQLLNRRASIALDLAELKQNLGLNICDPERERQVLAQVTSLSDGPFDERSLIRIFQRIIWESRRIEQQRQGFGGEQ